MEPEPLLQMMQVAELIRVFQLLVLVPFLALAVVMAVQAPMVVVTEDLEEAVATSPLQALKVQELPVKAMTEELLAINKPDQVAAVKAVQAVQLPTVMPATVAAELLISQLGLLLPLLAIPVLMAAEEEVELIQEILQEPQEPVDQAAAATGALFLVTSQTIMAIQGMPIQVVAAVVDQDSVILIKPEEVATEARVL